MALQCTAMAELGWEEQSTEMRRHSQAMICRAKAKPSWAKQRNCIEQPRHRIAPNSRAEALHYTGMQGLYITMNCNGKAEQSNAKKRKGKAKMRLDAKGKGGEYAKNPAKGR